MIKAELVGSDTAMADGITILHNSAPVIALCSALLKAGHDPMEPMEVYRGTTLALTVRSIGEAAKLQRKYRNLAQEARGCVSGDVGCLGKGDGQKRVHGPRRRKI